ncbi:MAG: PAS domain S-box protein, partial [bacterium]|nr:PAS domain S-box protein [bacterium]
LVENINVGIYRTKPEARGRFIHVNTELAKMLGYDSQEEMMNLRVEDTYEDQERRKDLLNLLMKDGFFKNIELRLKRKDGSIIWTEVSGSFLKDDEGREWIDGIVVDITNRKLTELALEETEDKLRTVAKDVPIIVFSFNMEGEILLSEGKGLESLNLKPGENVGKSIYDLYGAFPGVLDGLKKVLSGEQINTVVNFNEAYFEAWASPLKDNNGSVRGVSGIMLDITARKKIEEALIKSETNYKSLFENANDAIIIMEPETENILEANKKALDLYGFGINEFIEKSLKEISKNVNQGEKNIDKLLKGEELGSFETVHFNSKNEEIFLLVNASLIEYGGEQAILSIHHDISELNRMREQLNRAQKMESLGRLAGAVAHDLNHILTGLVTYPDLLLLDIEETDPFRPKIESIKNSGRRAAELVQDLLTMARGGIVNLETVNLNDIIAEF